VRPEKVVDPDYVALELAEKDPIRRKYGPIDIIAPYRDTTTGLLGAHSFTERFSPNKPIVFYFGPGMPDVYKTFFAGPGGLVEQTNNNILAKTGAKARIKVLNYNDAEKLGDGKGPIRQYGDPRYSFINWHSDLDEGVQGLLGVEQAFDDPRTGQKLSASVNV